MTSHRRRSARIIGALVGSALTVAMISAQQSPDTPVFRVESTGVEVDVSVKRGNRPVTGLTAADFVVIDNGVPHQVERVSVDAMPIDLTLVLDRSGSTVNILSYIQRHAERILGLLRPVDRVRILVLDSSVIEILPQQTVGRELALLQTLETGRLSSVRDAIVAALVSRAEPGRRRLVVAMTDGADTKSITTAQTMFNVGRQTDAVLHVIGVRSLNGVPGATAVSTSRPTVPMPDFFARPTMTNQEWNLFEDLAGLTGGEFHGTKHDSKSDRTIDAVRELRKAFNDFRQRYLLRFQPENVEEAGWHALTVKVKGIDAKGVRARRGYFTGVTPP